jgi:hypothetical protein
VCLPMYRLKWIPYLAAGSSTAMEPGAIPPEFTEAAIEASREVAYTPYQVHAPHRLFHVRLSSRSAVNLAPVGELPAPSWAGGARPPVAL